MAKISRTFSIESKVYDKFEDICKSKNINKSVVIQDAIKNFIGENYDIDLDADYKLKYGDSKEIVKIINKESEFILLSNGNKMNVFDFEMLYEEEDQGVKQVLRDLQSEKGVDVDDVVEPDILDKTSVFGDPDAVKKMFDKIDTNGIRTPNPKTEVRDVSGEDEQTITKDERTTEEKKEDLINKWRKEENLRREGKVEVNVKEIWEQEQKERLKVEPLSEEKKKDIKNRKKQRKSQLKKFKELDLNFIKETIEFIFDTNIEMVSVDFVSQNTGKKRTIYKFHIDKKYHNTIELKYLINLFTQDYDLVHMKEDTLEEKIIKRIKEINNPEFRNVCGMVSHIPTHLTDTIRQILKGIVFDGTEIEVVYDDPIYTIRLPKNVIDVGQILQKFILECYKIDSEYLILQENEKVIS